MPKVLKKAISPVLHFFALESAAGILLLAATICALLWSNLLPGYEDFWQRVLTVGPLAANISKPLLLWINDFLMAIFFLVVGLELKRELVAGELRSVRQALLPAGAALGGMVAPALIFVMLVHDPGQRHGWAIPMATDIAFALGCLRALGSRIPAKLVVFLTAVAVVDDLGAIIVIAAFYTAQLSGPALVAAAGLTAVLIAMNKYGVRSIALYVLVGLPLWVALLKSGVHATLAGVILGLAMPSSRQGEDSPALRLEHLLHPWVAFGVIPIFALANAGVVLDAAALKMTLEPVPLGVAMGLFFGKQIGILGGAWLVGRLGPLPEGLTWRHIYGASLLAGIGFTMALFIASLAYGPGTYFTQAKLGIICGSVLAAIGGVAVLATPRRLGNAKPIRR